MLRNLSLTIILADDDDDDCLLFNDILVELFPKVTVVRALNGKHLLELLHDKETVSTDVIFLDVNMPIKDGFEALTEIKKTEKLKMIPIIMFSTSAQNWSVDEAFRLGAHYFVQKPNSQKKLTDILKRLLQMDWSNAPQPGRYEFLVS